MVGRSRSTSFFASLLIICEISTVSSVKYIVVRLFVSIIVTSPTVGMLTNTIPLHPKTPEYSSKRPGASVPLKATRPKEDGI
jgi:hypothetical protein